ncbi:MAG: cytochrome P450 [Candidatus Marinimicrobia bacterium]|nr:cytochrome P450 [Candidatus Neomarinimicrobiota bacterium]
MPSFSIPHNSKDDVLRQEMMPYSLGPRACLGKHFADIELQAVLLTILHAFDLIEPDKNNQDLKFYVTLRPQSDNTVKIV